MARWWRQLALVLSGGNALGAFQAGAYAAMAERGLSPDWVAGSSIGSVNAALIAGNPIERRGERLADFWSMVAVPPAFVPTPGRMEDFWSAQIARGAGRPGMFSPTLPRPVDDWPLPGSDGLYSLAPLEQSLTRLVDFDLVRRGSTRLTVHATDLATGEAVVFDNSRSPVVPGAILASCALPPDFAPVELDGRRLGDGGLTANCPILDVLDDEQAETDILVVAIDLISPSGPVRRNLGDMFARRMEILLAANSAQAIRIARLRHDARGGPARLMVLHVVYTPSPEDSSQRLFGFGRSALERRWEAGRSAMLTALDGLPDEPSAGFTYRRF